MSEAHVVLAFILLAGAVVFAVRWSRRPKAGERSAALGGLATRLGWRFLGPEKYDGLDSLYPQFDQFDRGHARHAHDRLAGRVRAFDTELSAEAGDFLYEISSGPPHDPRVRSHRFSYLLVTLPFGPLLPTLRVRPINFVDKLASTSGLEDIDTGSAEFSKRHRAVSDNRRFTEALIDTRMLEFLLSTPPPHFELRGGVLLIASPPGSGDSRWRTDDFARALAWSGDFLARWPAPLVTDLRARC